jgi:hypothetical protein
VFVSGSSSGTLPVALVNAVSNDLSFGYWFKTTMTAPTAAQWYGGVSLVDAEVCGVTNDWGTALIDGGKVCLGIGNPDMTIKSVSSTYNDGAWHFVTATRSQVSGTITLYVDGVQVATASGANTNALTAPSLIGFGRNPCVSSGVYTGSLDDAIAYSRVLTPTEVTNLFNFYNSAPLPLLWLSFTGQPEGLVIHLKWETSHSINDDRFNVERSTDGSTYSVIGVITDQGGTPAGSGANIYTFADTDPFQGDNFYRIRQIDKDGRSSWSSVLAFSPEARTSGIHLQSNPVADHVTLVNNENLLIQRIHILDISGRVLRDQVPNSSNSTIDIRTSGIAPGYYLVTVSGGGKFMAIPFIKR